ncbi:MAG TPA: carboxypeptidase-like regulatory domain-containing protein [Pyrinomonadaceae bacterium]|nr:carboxypeptidase-like regulatory domain-containing protein [Pyrinomonadaceae bacterium]
MFSHRALAALLLTLMLASVAASAQQPSSANRQMGGIKGRVRVDSSSTPEGISVLVRRGEEEVARTTTNRKGEFQVHGLKPGSYGLTFRKTGLGVGRMENIEVRAGKVRNLNDRLYLNVDEGSIAFLKGSVFDQSGKSFRGARIELALIEPDGSLRKLDSRIANDVGAFAFRLSPAVARYRVTAKADGMQAVSEDVEVEGAAVFRVALTLAPTAK